MEWVVVPVALIILVGEYSAVLWLPALAASIWLVVKEPRSRKVLLPLAGGCLVCMLILWGGPKLEEAYDLRLRSWLTTGPLCLLVLLFLVKAGAALSVYSVLLWGLFFTLLTARPETVGDWRGQKVVMQELTWMETTYSYYAYNGPFLLGESLGWSEEPWGEDLG